LNGNDLLPQLADAFQPRLEDYCRTLEHRLYSSLIRHWAQDQDLNDSISGSDEKSTGILIQTPPRVLKRKNVSFAPGTIFAERRLDSPFWLKIETQRQQRRALRKVSAEAASTLSLRQARRLRKRRSRAQLERRKGVVSLRISEWGSSVSSGFRNLFSNLRTCFRKSSEPMAVP
jgi:hypothetical protein